MRLKSIRSGLCRESDEVGRWQGVRSIRDRKLVAEVAATRDAQLIAGVHQAEETVTAVGSAVTDGAAGEPPAGNLARDVGFRTVGALLATTSNGLAGAGDKGQKITRCEPAATPQC